MKKKRYVWIPVIVAAVLLLTAMVLMHLLKRSSYVSDQDVFIDPDALETETEQVHAEDLYHLEEVTHVSEEKAENTYTLLVIGAEDAAGKPGGETEDSSEPGQERQREDAQAVILMTINHNRKECFFESMHTNLYVQIPGFGAGRLGNAWAVGGGPLLCETIEENYGVSINHYAAISLREVARIIGIDEFENLDISEDGLEVVEELVYSLNAVEAIKVASYISSLMPYVTHNIDDQQMFRIILQIPQIVGYYSEKDKLPYTDLVTEADGYLVPDIGETSRRLQAFIYGE